MLTPLHSVIDREEHEKYFFCHYGNTEDLIVTALPLQSMSHSERKMGLYALFSVVFILQNFSSNL